jgi:hypothetical protein
MGYALKKAGAACLEIFPLFAGQATRILPSSLCRHDLFGGILFTGFKSVGGQGS